MNLVDFTRNLGLSDSKSIEWLLRISIAMTFIGHGMYGFVSKAGWLPFYHFLGFNTDWANMLMPLTGAMDVGMALFVLFYPLRLPFVHLAIWGIFTALLRPLVISLAPEGQYSMWEILERAGNFMPAIAVLAIVGIIGTKGFILGLFEKISIPPLNDKIIDTTSRLMLLATVLLLIGHGGYGAFVHKNMLMKHYASIGLTDDIINPLALVIGIGVFELVLAVIVAIKPDNRILAFIVIWKMVTESFYITSSSTYYDVNEWIERGGSYLTPLILIYLQQLKAKVDNKLIE